MIESVRKVLEMLKNGESFMNADGREVFASYQYNGEYVSCCIGKDTTTYIDCHGRAQNVILLDNGDFVFETSNTN